LCGQVAVRRRPRHLDHRRNRAGHDQVPHRRPPGVLAGLCPRTLQSGPRTRPAKGHGNSYLRGYLGQAANGAAGTATFLGERHARIARRRGGGKAQVAIARSILVIIWHVLADRGTRYTDLGPSYHERHLDKTRKTRNHVRQLEALGYAVTITQAA
jgi:hypothetical protein